MLLFSCGFLGPYFSNKRANLGGGSFNFTSAATGECKKSLLGVDLDAIELHNAVQRLSTRYAMKSSAAHRPLSIRVEEIKALPSERINVCAIADAGVEINPAIAKPVRAYLSIEYEADSIKFAVSIRGTTLLKLIPSRAIGSARRIPSWLERDFAPFRAKGFGRQVAPQNPVA